MKHVAFENPTAMPPIQMKRKKKNAHAKDVIPRAIDGIRRCIARDPNCGARRPSALDGSDLAQFVDDLRQSVPPPDAGEPVPQLEPVVEDVQVERLAQPSRTRPYPATSAARVPSLRRLE